MNEPIETLFRRIVEDLATLKALIEPIIEEKLERERKEREYEASANPFLQSTPHP